MNWIRENKFLAIFGGIILAAAIGLGVMIFLASGSYDAVNAQYQDQASQLQTLQAMQPYPEQANLKKKVEQQQAYAATIRDLQAKLAQMQYPTEEMEPAAFQDLLKNAVNQAVEKAQKNGVKLPDGFYLGFSEYQSSPPRREASGPLAKELKAINYVVNAMLDSKVAEISEVTRKPLPIESKPAAAPTPGRSAPTPKKPAIDTSVTVKPFEIGFTAEQDRFRRVLNMISSATEQFFVVRNLHVENELSKAPSKATPAPGDPAAPPLPDNNGAPADPNAPNPQNDWLKPLVGREKVKAILAIDIMDFAEPAAPKSAK